MDLIDIIKIKYNKLTPSEMKIADYVMKNPEKILEMSAQDIGNITGTSAATVVRFCKKIDVEGFDNLKVRIAQSSIREGNVNEVDPILNKNDSINDVVNKICSNVEIGLKRTISLIDIEVLEKVVTLLKSAKGIYVYAIGSSALSAQELYHKLNRVNRKTYFNREAVMSIEFSAYTQPDDVVIAISYSGNSKEVLMAVEQAKKNNTPIIAIVKEGQTKLSDMADYCLYVPNKEKKIRIGSLESKYSQMLLVDILYFAVVKDDIDSFVGYIKEISDSIGKLKG